MYNECKFSRKYNEDTDSLDLTRVMSGRMTKGRYKIVSGLMRSFNNMDLGRCGHEHDCCGCMCGISADFTYKSNQLIFTVKQRFNY